VDDRTESLNRKIREAQLANIPLILTLGNKEKEAGSLSVRTLDGTVKYGITMEKFLAEVSGHVADRKIELDLFKD
jgi:threonyl-tRNA synthetase